MQYFNILICCCTSFIVANANDDLVISLPVGKVKGSARRTINNVSYYSFQGIPYGEPPVKELRFLAPKEKKPWSGILDGTQQKQMCFQNGGRQTQMSEDCLFVNVFTPKKPSSNSTSNLPVLFYIHGGSMQSGYPDENNYGEQHIIERDIIFVTCNYRLGPFGFLSTGDLVVPGNAGLKDQTLALKWVQEHISYFGGDPTKVTIHGQSAGAASVALHLLSPLSAGLFRAGFSQSSSALGPNHCHHKHKLVLFKLAEYVDKKNPVSFNNSIDLLAYLQNQPAEAIIASARALESDVDKIFYPGYSPTQQGYLFAAVVEESHEGAFLTEKPYQQLKAGKLNRVPWLAGVTGTECLSDIRNVKRASLYDANPELLIPDDMNVPEEKRPLVAEMIRQFYVNGTTFSQSLRKMAEYNSDQTYARSIVKHVELQANFTDVYFYTWRYLGPMGGFSKVSVEGFSNDTRHTEDLGYVFARNLSYVNTVDVFKFSKMDRDVFYGFMHLVDNFVKTTNPLPEWKSFGLDANYLDIGSSFVFRKFPRWDMKTFWDILYNTYGTPPFETY